MDYTQILKQAFHFTKSHPLTWLFGLFLAGGSSLTLIEIINTYRHWFADPSYVALAGITFGAWLVLVSLIWIVFVIYVFDKLGFNRIRHSNEERAEFKTAVLESKFSALPIIALNLIIFAISLTIYLSTFDHIVPLLEPKFDWLATAAVYLPLLFLSYLELFASFFIILYRRRVFTSLSLASDLLFKRWKAIFAGAFVSIGLFGLLYVVIFLLLLPMRLLLPYLGLKLVMVLVVPISWAFTAIIHAFFYSAVIIFFNELVKPPFDPLAKKEHNGALLPVEGTST